jgi:hypothetical protein
LRIQIFFISLIIFIASLSHGQTAEMTEPSVVESSRNDMENPSALVPDPVKKNPLEVSVPKKNSEWVIAPIPGYNPSQGWTLALAVQNIFKGDSKSQPSILAGAIVVTEKKSYGGALGYLGRLREDNLKISAVGGYGKMNSDFYGVGKYPSDKDNSVLLEQDAKFFAVEVLPKIGPFFIGANILYMDLKNKFDVPNLPVDVDPSTKLNDSFWVPGLRFQWDTRDNYLYPTTGYLAELLAMFHDQNLSGAYTFQRYKIGLNGFYEFTPLTILGLRFHLDFVEGKAPFYSLPSFGSGGDLRGYKAGKYVDNIVWDVQAELRQRFTDKWGAVLFAGVGDVAHEFSDLSSDSLLSSGGVGLRYRLAKDSPMDFRVDTAYGDDEWSWYFSVGQAF